jgi:hypothetical protein
VIDTYEAVVDYADRHWADLETKNPDHPPPVLFVVAGLSMVAGRPLYLAVKARADDTVLLDAVEAVVTDAAFVADVQAAVRQAPHLSEVAKRHFITAFNWVGERKYVDAYPPFYNALESALIATARADGVIDSDRRLTRTGKRITKVDDLLGDLVEDRRYLRYLRSWIFGERGNPFRHGEADDATECRRQALRLAVATIGWLELFGEWTEPAFAERLERVVAARAAADSA